MPTVVAQTTFRIVGGAIKGLKQATSNAVATRYKTAVSIAAVVPVMTRVHHAKFTETLSPQEGRRSLPKSVRRFGRLFCKIFKKIIKKLE